MFTDAEMDSQNPNLKLQSQGVGELGFTPGSLALSVCGIDHCTVLLL